jgi:hypothetical protein
MKVAASLFLRNVGWLSPDYVALHPRTRQPNPLYYSWKFQHHLEVVTGSDFLWPVESNSSSKNFIMNLSLLCLGFTTLLFYEAKCLGITILSFTEFGTTVITYKYLRMWLMCRLTSITRFCVNVVTSCQRVMQNNKTSI